MRLVKNKLFYLLVVTLLVSMLLPGMSAVASESQSVSSSVYNNDSNLTNEIEKNNEIDSLIEKITMFLEKNNAINLFL